jgi:hypothetical protein
MHATKHGHDDKDSEGWYNMGFQHLYPRSKKPNLLVGLLMLYVVDLLI